MTAAGAASAVSC